MHLRFRELREERKLSQAEMAKILHVSQQTYSRYESHKTEIPLEKLVYLAKFFDTSVDYLLGEGITCFCRHEGNRKSHRRGNKSCDGIKRVLTVKPSL